ncbi:hypothetical protein [Saccharicrinis carchari]|nr:hypothetical protein [Saccharicrinis carchari]
MADYVERPGTYNYDANGNMTYDPAKEGKLTYNYLNLPEGGHGYVNKTPRLLARFCKPPLRRSGLCNKQQEHKNNKRHIVKSVALDVYVHFTFALPIFQGSGKC